MASSTLDPEQLRLAAPTLIEDLSEVLEPWVQVILENLENLTKLPKTITDPVWGVIQLYPSEVAFLDSPLLQRLRGIRQLGLAHLVYPGANHSRFEHTLGVLEASERMIRHLEQNADFRRRFANEGNIPEINDEDRQAIRMAALLHDVGHGPFSHLSEDLLRRQYSGEIDSIVPLLTEFFQGCTKIQPAELVSVLIVLSPALKSVFDSPRFDAKDKMSLPVRIAAHILGAWRPVRVGYLASVISGPLDADKLDYLARDSHHSGLRVGLELDRILSKLEVITVQGISSPALEVRLKAAGGPVYDLGLSRPGVSAYEQLVIARMILFDRLYHHQKVRSAEAMLRELLHSDQGLTLREFLSEDCDDAVLGQRVNRANGSAGELGRNLRMRRVYHRALVFAARFFAGLDEDRPDLEQTRINKWDAISKELEDPTGQRALAKNIHERSRALGACSGDPKLAKMANDLKLEEVIVDLPKNRALIRADDLLVRSERALTKMTMIFNSKAWSDAYENRKRRGFVFAPNRVLPLVQMGAAITFAERFGVVINADGRAESKGSQPISAEVLQRFLTAGKISQDVAEQLGTGRGRLIALARDNISLPPEWINSRAHLNDELVEAFNRTLPNGVTAEIAGSVADAIEGLCRFINTSYSGGDYQARRAPGWESDLQHEVIRALKNMCLNADQHAEQAAGKTDVVLNKNVVIELKVEGVTADPWAKCRSHAAQVRSYSLALSSPVDILLMAYQPKDEHSRFALSDCIRIEKSPVGDKPRALLMCLLPYGYPFPSHTKVPKATPST